MPQISVIIPIYNAERFIEKTVNSLLCQTFDNFEIVLVDDGSADSSLKIMNDLASKDKRIIAIHQENAGVSIARNTGIKNSCGKYLVFCDADDEFENDAFEKYMAHLNNFDFDFIISGFQKIYVSNVGEKQIISKRLTYSRTENRFFSNNEVRENLKEITSIDSAAFKVIDFNPVWNKIYKAEIIKKNNIYFPEGVAMGEDYRFNLAYLNCVNSVLITPEITYHYIVNTDSATFKFRNSDFKIRCETLEISSEFYIKNGYDVSQTIYLLYIKIAYSVFANMFLSSNSNIKDENKRLFFDILNDEHIVKAVKNFKPKGIFAWLSWKILKTKNYYLVMLISYILYQIRRKI